ncbi:MAG: molybdopterin converting factor subunit 1 [Rhodospirillaceae bacterium]|jgi:molybdopterin synthase sulfur carrier subunit|nr:molybdopterin converting factor subunit 1 [Rhodospirillaceae bacterium]
MQVLYFGWVRARIGIGKEELSPPPEVTTVASLIDWLKGRGDGYATAFEDSTSLRVAVNQEIAQLDAEITDGDEVAVFPPMTGG